MCELYQQLAICLLHVLKHNYVTGSGKTGPNSCRYTINIKVARLRFHYVMYLVTN